VVFAAEATGPSPKEVAAAYGVDGFKKIVRLAFTFNVERDGKMVMSRRWVWEPKTDQVTYMGPGEKGNRVTLNYNRHNDPKMDPNIEQAFINDSYWLLFPLHLAWDTGMTVTNDGVRPLPIPPGQGQRLTVTYAKDVGFTPGDVYELYLGANSRVVQWVYRHSGTGEPRIMNWTENRQLGPIVVALEHLGPEGRIHLWFSDVSATVGSQEVVPQPLD
jgi:hypothetical protein